MQVVGTIDRPNLDGSAPIGFEKAGVATYSFGIPLNLRVVQMLSDENGRELKRCARYVDFQNTIGRPKRDTILAIGLWFRRRVTRQPSPYTRP